MMVWGPGRKPSLVSPYTCGSVSPIVDGGWCMVVVWWRIENETQNALESDFRRTVLATSHDATSLLSRNEGIHYVSMK
jgi:hypothetical protein